MPERNIIKKKPNTKPHLQLKKELGVEIAYPKVQIGEMSIRKNLSMKGDGEGEEKTGRRKKIGGYHIAF